MDPESLVSSSSSSGQRQQDPTATISVIQNAFSFNVPRATKYMLGFLIVTSVIGIFVIPSDFVNVFGLIPNSTLPPNMYVWNMFTAQYFETSIIEVSRSLITLFGQRTGTHQIKT